MPQYDFLYPFVFSKRQLLLLPLMLSFGCASKEPPPQAPYVPPPSVVNPVVQDVDTAEEPAASVSRDVVAAELSEIYIQTLDRLTNDFFSGQPRRQREHGAAMKEFIRENYSSDEFVQRMLALRSKPTEDGTPVADPDADFSVRERNATLVVGSQVLTMLLKRQRAIYLATHVEEDPTRLELLHMDATGEYSDFIRWVDGEVSMKEFRRDPSTAGYQVERSDRIFAYSTPEELWKEGQGQRGYLVVRKGRINGVMVTAMN